MRLKGVALGVVEELRRRDIEVSYDVAKLILELALEIIKQETSKGGTVWLDNFIKFQPKFEKYSTGWSGWKIRMRRSPDWRQRCRFTRGETPMKEKYAYEKEQEDPRVKTASEKGRCPKCGAEVRGNPPVCPNHGSEPFERREDGEGQG